MRRVDDILIDGLVSPAAGWLEHRLGIGRWRAAAECLNVHVALYLAGTGFSIAGKGLRDAIFADLLAALAWLLIIEAVRRRAHRQEGSSLGVQTARLGERPIRAILLAALPLSFCFVRGWDSGCYTASLLFLAAHLYLKACDTPPPRRRRALASARA